MKLMPPQSLSQLATLLGCEFDGDPAFMVTGINEIHRVEHGDIVFVDHPKYYDKALNSAASVVIINQKITAPQGKCLIFSDDPFTTYNNLTKHFSPWTMPKGTQGEHIHIHRGAHVHSSVIMGHNITIGDGCIIHPGVVLYDNITIGDRSIIHANCVIGSDAFYYKSRPTGREKMHSVGSVFIGHDVEIGASCTAEFQQPPTLVHIPKSTTMCTLVMTPPLVSIVCLRRKSALRAASTLKITSSYGDK